MTLSTATSRAAAVTLALVAFFTGSRAHAGPVEQLVEMATPPGKSDSVLLRYLNGGGGLWLSTDATKTWSLQCDSAFLGKGGRTPGPIIMLADKTPLVLSSAGIAHSDANGCGFKVESPEITANAVDVAQNPMDPSKAYAVISNPTGMSGLAQRGADGTWTDFGVKDTLNPISLRVGVKAGALRFYEIVVKTSTSGGAAGSAAAAGTGAVAGTGAAGTGAVAGTGAAGSGTGTITAMYVLRVSDDEAKTWQEYPLPQDAMGGRPRLAAVDPTNVDRVVIVMENDNAVDTIYLSKDGGKTTAKYLEIDAFGGITFAPDGRVWIGDGGLISGISMTRGMYAAASLDATPTRLPMAMYPVQCVGWAADSNTLYACQKFWFGKVDLETGAWTTMVTFTQIPKFVSCPGEDTAAQCKDQLCLDWCGPAHFAIAPVCSESYNDESCGKPVAEMEGADFTDGSSGTTGAAAGGGAGAAAGSAAVAGAGGMSVASAGTTGAAGTSNAGSAAAAAPPTKSDSGCSCEVPGGAQDGGAALFALGLAAAFWRRRRTRSCS